jgi:hypothetical protein
MGPLFSDHSGRGAGVLFARAVFQKGEVAVLSPTWRGCGVSVGVNAYPWEPFEVHGICSCEMRTDFENFRLRLV